MAKRLKITDKYGNVVPYDISAASVTIDAEGKTLEVKLTELVAVIASAVKSVTFNGNTPTIGSNGNVNIGQQMQANWDESDTGYPTYIRNKPNVVTGIKVGASGQTQTPTNGVITLPEPSAQVTVDDAMSGTSDHAVQNKVIKAYVDNLINSLINGAPAALDTLKELADALGNNDDAIAALTTAIAAKANDNAVVKTISVNGGTAQTPTDGNVNIEVTGGEQADWNENDSSDPAYINNKPTIPTSLSQLAGDSTHRVVTDAEKAAWNGKQNGLTFDQAPTDGSQNPVTSDAVYNAIEDKLSQVTVNAIPAGSIAVEDSLNSTSGTNALSANKGRELKEIIGAPITYNDTVLDITKAASGSAQLYPYELHAGDKLRLVYTLASTQSLTVCTNANGTNKDFFINNAQAPTEGDIEITLTADADAIKVFNSAQVEILITISRIKPLSELMSDLAEEVGGYTESIEQLNEEVEGINVLVQDLSYLSRWTAGFINAVSNTSAFGKLVTDGATSEACDYIDISGYETIIVTTFVSTNANTKVGLVFYDAAKSPLTGVIATVGSTEGLVEQELTPPTGAVYLRTTRPQNSSGSWYLKGIVDAADKATALDKEIAALDARIDNISDSSDDISDGEAILGENNRLNGDDFLGIVMLDNNYKYFSVANIKLILDAMGATGLNCLELGFGGSGRGLSFELNDMTFTAYDGIQYDISEDLLTSSDKYLSEADMIEIISYAASKGVTIMPSLNVLSHMDALLRNRQSFCYQNAPTSLNFNNPTAVNFALGVAEMYAKWFAYHGCKHFNICTDEFKISGILDNYTTLQSNGIYGYATFINRLARMLGKYRYTVHIYNDPLSVNGVKYPFINRNLVVHFWEGKANWATSEELLAEGHQLVNSSLKIYWVCNGGQVSVNTISSFNIKKFNDLTPTIHENIPRGAKFCIWIGNRESPALDDDGDAITTDVLPLITAFGQNVSSQLTPQS